MAKTRKPGKSSAAKKRGSGSRPTTKPIEEVRGQRKQRVDAGSVGPTSPRSGREADDRASFIDRLLGEDALGSLGVPGPQGREAVRRVVEDGIPVEAVRELQDELRRFGVPRPSTYVESIATRASRSRRATLTREEGERLVRVAATLARALDVWEDEEAAAAFLNSPHPELGGESPIDRARSEIGARQVEDLLLRLDLGLPV